MLFKENKNLINLTSLSKQSAHTFFLTGHVGANAHL